MRGWRNWYTRQLEVLVPAKDWRFESSPAQNYVGIDKYNTFLQTNKTFFTLFKLCYNILMMKRIKNKNSSPFIIEFEREEDGRWIAEISKIPGAMAYGSTKQEAERRAYAIALRTLADSIEQGNTPAASFRFFEHAMAHR